MKSNRATEDALGTWRLSLYAVLLSTAFLGWALSNPVFVVWCLGIIKISPSTCSSHYLSFWGRRQTGTPQGKAIGDSFSIDRNSKTRIAGQLRDEGGPCTDHIFLIPKVRRPPQPHTHKKCSLEAKGELCQVMFHPYAFVRDSILAKRCVCTLERILRYTTYALWTKQIRMIGQRKLGRNTP